MISKNHEYFGFPAILKLGLLLVLLQVPSKAASQHPDDRYWTPVSAFDGEIGLIDGIASADDVLYLGGHFTRAGNVTVYNLANWDGATWRAVGGSVGTKIMGMVHSIVKAGEDIFVAGMFDQVSIWPASHVARWDGANWDTMAGGTDRAVRSIARAANGDIYVGGEFISAGGKPMGHIARWDGSAWHNVGGGMNHHVMSILINGNDVYVGGRFSQAGGKPIPFLARWDGTEWHAVGSTLNGFVTALQWAGGKLYVGGGFSLAGRTRVNRIAMWNGRWNALGQGVSGPGLAMVRTILVDSDYVYIGGNFRFAGGVPTNYIARWNGDGWDPLGSGTDRTVKNMAKHGHELYVTGEFKSAGGKRSYYVASWYKPAVLIERFGAQTSSAGVLLDWDVVLNEDFGGYRIYRKDTRSDETLLNDVPLPVEVRNYTDTSVRKGLTYEYTLAAVLADGSEIRSEVSSASLAVPSVVVSQNYPNPFNPSTSINYILPAASRVNLSIFDPSGALVRILVDDVRDAGPHVAVWDGRDRSARSVASGVYFYRFESSGVTVTGKMILLK